MLRLLKTVNYWHFLPLTLLIGLIISGCGPAAPGANDSPTGQKAVESQTVNEQTTSTAPPTESSVKDAIDIESTTDSQTEEEVLPNEEEIAPVKTTTSKRPMTNEEVNEVMEVLLDPNGPEKETVDRILESGDERFVSVLLELMRARQIGIIVGSYDRIIDALQELSDQSFLDDWPAWVEWYGQSDLEPPPGFTGWKGRLLGRIDQEFTDFLRDEFPSRIRTEEIMWGGVSVDGIPPLENAPMIPGLEAEYLLDEEPVFGVVVNGDARAYPLRIIDTTTSSAGCLCLSPTAPFVGPLSPTKDGTKPERRSLSGPQAFYTGAISSCMTGRPEHSGTS
jgi:hypothetical protein